LRIIPDTNVLVRASVEDDEAQTKIALRVLAQATAIVIPAITLCEYVWVLKRVYKRPNAEIARSLELLVASGNVEVDGRATQVGLRMLKSGGDFADGVIAFEGQRLGGDTFVTFDRKAAGELTKAGHSTLLLASEAPH
jgi:predicted nucleic-acid-binding protein